MMSNSAGEITNLLYRYAERMDGGDLEGAANIFLMRLEYCSSGSKP
jgi:hypothetical protein